jgi:hypothetical protein
MTQPPSDPAPAARGWMFWWLTAAGIYNLAWGTWAIFRPNALFDWVNVPRPNYPQLWQCIGMIVGVYGIGYLIAARNPLRHWPIVLVGLLGKILGPIGAVQGILAGTWPKGLALVNITNDAIWWIPFALILLRARRAR